MEVIEPPAEYLHETPKPLFVGRLNKDIVLYVREVQSALQECNDDKAAARKYVEEVMR